jgi:hypothetical protein
VIADRTVEQVLSELNVVPDWETRNADAPPLMVLHRSLPEGEIYFLSSRVHHASHADVAFRVTGRLPEQWDANSGTRKPLAFDTGKGVTIVPVSFDPDGSALIVFRERSGLLSRDVPRPAATPILQLDSGWTLSFQGGRGAPQRPIAATTGSWTDSSVPGVRYFSGTGTYSRSFDLVRSRLAHGHRVVLELGEVDDLAEVVVNGVRLGILWKRPYTLDITDAVKAGRNRIEVRVTNLWVNRLIGDAQPGAIKIAHVAEPVYRADAPLRASGLLGPVRLLEIALDRH